MTEGGTIGPYELIAPIGAGAMGEVYRARDPRLGRDVAIKVVATGAGVSSDRLRRFQQEAQAAAALQHPNIVAVHDVGVHNGCPYIVQELLEGSTLRQRLADGPLPLGRAIETAIQIAKGLASAHDRRVVHRDLKPENVFLTRDGSVKILDFGLAKVGSGTGSDHAADLADTADCLTLSGTILGTVGYMSPEQVRGESVDHRADIFSLGVILYEMLAGRRPFSGRTPADVMTAVLREEAPPIRPDGPSQVPAAIARLVGCCLEKDPNLRMQSARDLAIALDAALLSTPPTGMPTVPAPVAVRRWLAPVAAAALGALTVTGFLVTRSTTATGVLPSFTRLTFQSGTVSAARFGSDPSTIVYTAEWGDMQSRVYTTKAGSPESMAQGAAGLTLAAVSPSGELAVIRDAVPSALNSLAIVGTLARMPAAGGAPRDVVEGVEAADWSPDGSRLAVVRTFEGRGRLEYPVGTVLFETAGWLDGIRISPDGTRIAVAEHPLLGDDRGWVGVVDVATRRFQRLTAELNSMRGLAWSRSGREIFHGFGRQVLAVSMDGSARMIATGTQLATVMDVATDGSVLVNFVDLSLQSFMVEEGREERDVSWLDGTVPLGFWPDKRRLLFWEGLGYGAYYRDLDGSAAVRLGDGTPLAVSPDGGLVLAMQHTSPERLVVYPTGAGETRTLATAPVEGIGWGHWVPDGRIVFSGEQSGRESRLYTTTLTASGPTAIGPEGATLVRYSSGAVSPDGRQVVAVSKTGAFILVPLAGGQSRPIEGMKVGDLPVRWDPSGRSVLVREQGARWPLRLMDVDILTGKRTLHKELRSGDLRATRWADAVAISPDGRSIAFQTLRTQSKLFRIRTKPDR